MLFSAEAIEKALKNVLLGVVLVSIVLVAFAGHFRELGDLSALDTAQIARNLPAGRGYVTSTPTPLSLAVVTHAERHRELARPPAYVATVAAAIRLFGATDRTVALTSMFFLLLCVSATYLLAVQLFGRTTAIISTLALVSVPSTLSVSSSGTDAPFLMLLTRVLRRRMSPGRRAPYARAPDYAGRAVIAAS